MKCCETESMWEGSTKIKKKVVSMQFVFVWPRLMPREGHGHEI